MGLIPNTDGTSSLWEIYEADSRPSIKRIDPTEAGLRLRELNPLRVPFPNPIQQVIQTIGSNNVHLAIASADGDAGRIFGECRNSFRQVSEWFDFAAAKSLVVPEVNSGLVLYVPYRFRPSSRQPLLSSLFWFGPEVGFIEVRDIDIPDDRDLVGRSENLAEFVPNVEVVTLDCGHWIQEEKPEETNQAILTWLKQQAANYRTGN